MSQPCPLLKNSFKSPQSEKATQSICECCKTYYSRGWLNSFGGGISVRDGNKIYFGPVGASADGPCPLNIFILDVGGKVNEICEINSALSEQKSLMMVPHILFNAGAVLHTHSMDSMFVTWIYAAEVPISDIISEKFKSVPMAEKFADLPIIENNSDERLVKDSLSQVWGEHPDSHGVLIRGHGIYVWGKDIQEAKHYLETYESVFRIAIGEEQKKILGGGNSNEV